MIEENIIREEIYSLENNLYQEPCIIVFVPNKKFNYSFWESISDNGLDVYIFDSEDEIDALLEKRLIDKLYIQTSNKSQFQSLASRFKLKNANSEVIFFSSTKDILFNSSDSNNQLEILKDNFKLTKSLLPNLDSNTSDFIDQTVKYVELLCLRLHLTYNQKIKVIAATYAHNLTTFKIENESGKSAENYTLNSISQFLRTNNYTSDICDILDHTYTDISAITQITEVHLLANILTASDFYCRSKYNNETLTTDEFKQLNQLINSKIDSLLLPDVGQELFNILYKLITVTQPRTNDCFILMYNETGEDQLMLKSCLENLGFETKLATSIDELVESYKNRKVHILIIESTGTVLEVSDVVNKIEDRHIYFEDTVTYLLTNSESLFELTGLLQKGIEDIFCIEKDLDPLLIKLIRSRKRIDEQANKKITALERVGTFGSLADMNLIDLLQTMNINGKTCLLNVTAKSNQLTIYIDNGIIVYAVNENTKGEQAIFKGLNWNEGVWNVDPIDVKDFPEPNINKPINSILLEGCQYMDESQKIGTKPEDQDQFDIDESFKFLED